MSSSERSSGSSSEQFSGSDDVSENLQGGIPDSAMAQAIGELLEGKRRSDHEQKAVPERSTALGTERSADGGDGDEGQGAGASGDEGGDSESEAASSELSEGSEGKGEDSRSDKEAGDGARSAAAEAVAKLIEGSEGGVYTLKELAGALDIPTDALYKMRIPLGDGNDGLTSIEELKQRHKALGPLDEEQRKVKERAAALEVRQLDHENKVAQARQELGGVVELVKRFAPPEFIEKARELSRERANAEARELLKVMPQFADPVNRKAWVESSAEALAPYGFSMGEVQNLGDHRVFRVVDAFVRMSKRLRELEDLSGDRKTPPKAMKRKARNEGGAKSKSEKAREKAKRTGSREDQRAALDAMLDAGEVFGG